MTSHYGKQSNHACQLPPGKYQSGRPSKPAGRFDPLMVSAPRKISAHGEKSTQTPLKPAVPSLHTLPICLEAYSQGSQPAPITNLDCSRQLPVQAYLAFGDPGYLRMFVEVYAAAMQRLQLAGRWASTGWLADMHIGTGQLLHPWISSLSAFWPGLQVLAGGFSPQLLAV